MKNLSLILLSIFFCSCNLREEIKEPSKNSSANTSNSYSSIKTGDVQNMMAGNADKPITKRTAIYECDELLELLENRRKQYSDDDGESIDYKYRAKDYKIKEELVNQILFNKYAAHAAVETSQEKEKLAKTCEAMKEYIDDLPIRDL